MANREGPVNQTQSASRQGFSGLAWSGFILGFSLGGFFDGILLHQVLQWHHFLSGVENPAVQDIRVQILADGLFHVAMYLVGGVALFLLWRSRRALGQAGSGRVVAGSTLIGFGVWQFADVILAHWVLGIHRIRMDTDLPLAWDLGWLLALGPAPIIAGWLIRQRKGGGTPLAGGQAAASVLAALLLVSGAVALLPPRGESGVIVMFRPGLPPAQMMEAVAAAGGRMLWTDASGEVWGIDLDEPSRARELYRDGALLVSTSLSPAGCLTWTRPA